MKQKMWVLINKKTKKIVKVGNYTLRRTGYIIGYSSKVSLERTCDYDVSKVEIKQIEFEY